MTGRRLATRILSAAMLVLVARGAGAQPAKPPPATPAAQPAKPAPLPPTAEPPAPAPPGQSPVPLAGGGRIGGIVKSASDDTPIGRARVSATSDVLPEPRVTLSEPDGKYALTDLPPGSYTVSATRTGYAPQTYALGRSITPTPIVVGGAQRLPAIDFALVPGGLIVGRILDEDGSPFAGAMVDALVTRSNNGTDTFQSVASSQTDDRGEFRLFGLAPGLYYVSAADPAFRAVSTPKGVLHYSPTYFPGVAFADQAKAVTLSGSGEPPMVEFALKLVPPSRVSGRLSAENGRQLFSAALIMSPVEGVGVPMVPPDDPKLLPDGTFSFGEVVPGHYQIRARGETDPGGIALFGTFTLQILGNDVQDITIFLHQGAVLDGRVSVSNTRGTKAPHASSIRVRAPFVDGNAFGDSLTGTVQADGTFALRGMMKGAHQVVVEGLPPPWIVESVFFRGTDITDVQFDVVQREQFRDVRLTISDTGREVTGVVQNARQLPVANTAVLVFPRVPLFWVRTNRRMRIAYTDRAGRFTVPGLPAGEYYAVASLAVDESDLGRGDRLLAWERVATQFELAADRTRTTITLPLVAPPAAPLPARR